MLFNISINIGHPDADCPLCDSMGWNCARLHKRISGLAAHSKILHQFCYADKFVITIFTHNFHLQYNYVCGLLKIGFAVKWNIFIVDMTLVAPEVAPMTGILKR